MDLHLFVNFLSYPESFKSRFNDFFHEIIVKHLACVVGMKLPSASTAHPNNRAHEM